MTRTITAALTALALAAGSVAPAHAYDRRGGGYHHYDRGHYYHHDRHNGDAAAAGAIGLVLGLALGAALSDPGPRRARCYDNYRRCAPPPGYGRYQPDAYYDGGYGPPDYQGYAPGDARRQAYARDYGVDPEQGAPRGYYSGSCIHPARHWDPYSGTYVWVNVRSC